MIGGWLLQHYGMNAVFMFNAAVASLWLLLAITMKPPVYLSSQLINLGALSEARAEEMAQRLSRVNGVVEATVIAEDGVAYLKVEKNKLDSEALNAFSVSEDAA